MCTPIIRQLNIHSSFWLVAQRPQATQTGILIPFWDCIYSCFINIILTFGCNAQRTRLILSILIHIRWKSSSKNKRWKISALAHRLKITYGNSYFIPMFLHTRIRDRNSCIPSAIGCCFCVTFATLMGNVADYFS